MVPKMNSKILKGDKKSPKIKEQGLRGGTNMGVSLPKLIILTSHM